MGAHISRRSARDVQRVLDGIRRIVQGLRESSRRTERRVGLTAAQLFVLRRLAEADTLSINELARKTFTHQSSVSVVASRLAARRLVRRSADRRDRRRRILALTPAGRHALAIAPPSAQERLVAAVVAMPPAARSNAAAALAALADAMAVERHPSMFFEERERS